MGKSLERIGKLGAKVLYLPLARRASMGTAESMVLWVPAADGKYTHDFSRVEKYLDLALKHAGKPRFVVAGVWDSCMHVSVPQGMKRGYPRISVRDPRSGKSTTADGTRVRHAGERGLLAARVDQLRDLLAKLGLADALLIGYCADRQPDEATVGVFHAILPDAGWQATRHPPIANDQLPYRGGARPIRYQPNVWGGWDNWDSRRPPRLRLEAPGQPQPADVARPRPLRRLADLPVPPGLRAIALGRAARAGADRRDFRPVPGPDGKTTSTMVGRFPLTSEGNLGIYAGQLLYPGPDGPAPSVRYLMLRENIQECEARIFLEKLLLESPSRLPARCGRKAQAVLDERTRWHRVLMLGPAPESADLVAVFGLGGGVVQLYEAAAEAALAIAETHARLRTE